MDGYKGRLSSILLTNHNLVTFYIFSSGSSGSPKLHKLIYHLKSLKLTLAIYLEVVYIPGTHMINQRTDGLSRGLRLAGGGNSNGIPRMKCAVYSRGSQSHPPRFNGLCKLPTRSASITPSLS
jgi:hypothetical protein